MLATALHPAVEAAPIREVEVCQPRLPLSATEGGGDRVGLAVILGHGSGPLVAVLDLEALLVARREVPVPHELIAGKVEEGLGEEIAGSRRAEGHRGRGPRGWRRAGLRRAARRRGT